LLCAVMCTMGVIITAPVSAANNTEPAVITFNNRMMMNAVGTDIKTFPDLSKYTFVIRGDYKDSVKMEYHPTSSLGRYAMMPYFKDESLITMDHKYVRITYLTTDEVASTITLKNNAGKGMVTLVPNTAESKGEWVTSAPVNINTGGLLERFDVGNHNTVCYNNDSPDAVMYIKEMAFFTSLKQAYEYYGEEVPMAYSTMTFGANGTGTTLDGSNYGAYTVNTADSTLDITYAASTNMNVNYMAKLKFKEASSIDRANKYARFVYSADNPEGASGVVMKLRNDKYSNEVIIVGDVKDTNGFVITPTVELADNMMERFSGSGEYAVLSHNSLMFTCPIAGGTYRIKAVYFFANKEEADSFVIPSDIHEVSINGNDISKYQIVIAEDASFYTVNAANSVAAKLKELSGVSVPVVNDSSTASEYEILVGPSKREKAYLPDADGNISEYVLKIDTDTVIIGSNLVYNITYAVDVFFRNYLYEGISAVPEKIEVPTNVNINGVNAVFKEYNNWLPVANVDNPAHITDDFSSDDGKWTEENNASDWAFKNGAYATDADGFALSYLHIYEQNVTFDAKMTVTSADKNGDAGLMLRYNAEDAYVKAGYDFDNGAWYIENREGADFHPFRTEVKAAFEKSKAYELSFAVDGENASLYVNGKETVTAKVTHITAGRIAVYAENAAVTVDDADIALLSGQGTLIKNIIHTKIPENTYMEGGSVWEMNDGSLTYEHHSGTTYASKDNGVTWQKAERWIAPSGYMNVIRLNNGDFMQAWASGSNWISRTSSDEGKTWTNGGVITARSFEGASAGNMNDKFFQSATTDRIFYSQNYEITTGTVDGRKVFCEFFYSDDNGKSWKKSETASWEIEGNEGKAYFGECKILECADGTLRMYNSWNDYYGCIVYSESTDNGVTWGPIQMIPELRTSRSSMQFVRDRYADNDTTYYMVWIYSDLDEDVIGLRRSRLSLAKTTDGKNWEYLGDIWRWEHNYRAGQTIAHIVDPFIQVTKDYIICGSGFAEQFRSGVDTDSSIHYAQRQHIYSIKKDTLPEAKTLNKFTDIDTGATYYDAVSYVVGEGLFNGTSDKTFSPNASMTRAMFVTVLGRLSKADVTKYATPTFDDVKAGQWYTSYVEWAAANGIVNGLGNGIYGINNNVTVEQALTILYRYANGKTASTKSALTPSDFTDASSVSDWAADAVKWAVQNGIYEGIGTRLEPKAMASRALVATMFANYVKAMS